VINPFGKGLRAWLLVLFVLNLIYLVYELAFNSRLVDAAVASLTRSQVLALELEGRILSGIGLSLLLLRLIKVQGRPLLRSAGAIGLAIAIGFPLMFYGQRILVDTLVDRTSAEQRMDAQHLLLLKRGLANNALQLDGIPFDDADLDSAHTRSFLSVLGLMTFVSPEFIDSLKTEADRIIDQVVVNEATRALPEHYEEYRQLQTSLQQAWRDYEQVSDEYWHAQADLSAEAEARWHELQAGLMAEWQALAGERNEQAFTRQVLTLQRSLSSYFQARERCDNGRFRDECIIRIEDIYRDEVTRNLGRYVAPHDWCHEPEIVTNTVQRRGRFVTERQEIQRCHDLDFDHLAGKLTAITQQAMTYEQFLASDAVAAEARDALAEEGLTLPAGWRPSDRDAFLDAVISEPMQALGQRADDAMQEQLGATLPLDLSAESFLASQPVQDRLHEALRPRDRQMLISLDLDPEAFRDAILTPHYQALAAQERARLFADAQALANGAPREEEGKQYVRALIVPPIAMGFSLFFALVNAIGLAASLPALLGSRRRWPPHLIKVTGLGLVLALPMANSAAVVKTETYRYFAGEAERALSPLGSLFATWVINTEPVVYPLGRVMAFLAPPLVSASAEQVASEQDALEAPEIQTVPERAGQGLPPESPPVQPVSSAAAMPEVSRVAHLDVTRPLFDQVEEARSRQQQAVMVDLQLLSDRHWAIHRSPIISGQGTCLTNFQRVMDISRVDSLQWRAARHASCGSEALAERPVAIPTALEFARQFQRGAADLSLWTHFQPTLHGEVNCHAVRREADALADLLGPQRFAAAVSRPEVLSCFAQHERDYALAYFGPEHGSAEADDGSLRHLTLADARRLRERARGEAYREHAQRLSAARLQPALDQLAAGDAIIVHHRHLDDALRQSLDAFTGRHGVFGPGSALPNAAADFITVTRD